MPFRHVRNEPNMDSDIHTHYDNDIERAVVKFVYSTLTGPDLSVNPLPGLSLKSDSKKDPLHEHFVRGFSSGLQTFLEDDASGKDLCQNLSAKGILQNIGLTEAWRQGKDALRDMLYQRALLAAEQAIQRLKSMATKSEVGYALKQALKDFRRYLDKGDMTFEYIFAAVKIKVNGKQVTPDLFWEACRETNIPVPNQTLEATVFVPEGFFPTIDNAVLRPVNSSGTANTSQVLDPRVLSVTGPTSIKIGELNVYGGNVSFGDRITTLRYSPTFGVNKEELKDLIAQIKGLSQDLQSVLQTCFETMKNAKTDNERQTTAIKILSFLKEHGLAVADSLTASVILELAKHLFKF